MRVRIMMGFTKNDSLKNGRCGNGADLKDPAPDNESAKDCGDQRCFHLDHFQTLNTIYRCV